VRCVCEVVDRRGPMQKAMEERLYGGMTRYYTVFRCYPVEEN